MSYTGGIYEHTWGSELGGHSVKIVGWAQGPKGTYWIIANSWGANWGINGYFYIYTNQCGISSQGIAGLPA